MEEDLTVDKNYKAGFNLAYWLQRLSKDIDTDLKDIKQKAPKGSTLAAGLEAGEKQSKEDTRQEMIKNMDNLIKDIEQKSKRKGFRP